MDQVALQEYILCEKNPEMAEAHHSILVQNNKTKRNGKKLHVQILISRTDNQFVFFVIFFLLHINQKEYYRLFWPQYFPINSLHDSLENWLHRSLFKDHIIFLLAVCRLV